MAVVSMMLPLFITLARAVLLVGALDDLDCTVTQEAGRTVCQVPKFRSTSATDCEYSWINATGHVLANHLGKETTGLVVKQNITTLTTARCLEGIVYTRDCISEGVQREAKCICPNTTTHYNATVVLSVEEPETPHESAVVVPVVVPVVVLVLVSILVVVLILWRKKCKNPSQTRSTSYTVVMMQSLPPQQS